MDTITIKCPVTVKAKVTDSLKKQIVAEIQEAIKKADLELQQIEFHAKRMMAEQAKQDAQGLVGLRQQIDAEKQKRIKMKNHLLEKLKKIGTTGERCGDSTRHDGKRRNCCNR